MDVIVISNYPLIREGISSILSKNKNISIQLICQTIKEALFTIKNNKTDIILIDLHKENMEELNLIDKIIKFGIKTTFIILDFYGDSKFFVEALKIGVQGYILGKSTETEMFYAMNQIYKGRKYFDSYLIANMVNGKIHSSNDLELLTGREREILMEI